MTTKNITKWLSGAAAFGLAAGAMAAVYSITYRTPRPLLRLGIVSGQLGGL
jgi:hypothetical protein